MEYYLRRQVLRPPARNEIHVLVSGRRPVNAQIMKMIKRRVRVLESDFLWSWLRRMQGPAPREPGRQGAPPDTPMWLNLRHAGYMVEWETWQEVGPQLSFTDDEIERGQALLQTLGIPQDAPYVCMHARDKAYTDDPDGARLFDDPFTFNDFRDCDIETYLPAAEYLTEQGIWVVRVGYRVMGPLSSSCPMIIDYASHFRRHLPDPEFADVYLQAQCKFYLGCTAGIIYFSHIFDVPGCYVNRIPLAESGWREEDLFILKKYWHGREKRFLTWREMVDRGWDWSRVWHDRQRALRDEGVEIIDNTPDGILAVTKEMNMRLDGTWVPHEDDVKQNDRFRAVFPTDHPMRKFPGYQGSEFLRDTVRLLD